MKSVETYDPSLGVWDFLVDQDTEEEAQAYIERRIEEDRRNLFLGKGSYPMYFIRDDDSELMAPLPDHEMRVILNQMRDY